jgi:hypothetical protein
VKKPDNPSIDAPKEIVKGVLLGRQSATNEVAAGLRTQARNKAARPSKRRGRGRETRGADKGNQSNWSGNRMLVL